MNEIEYNLLDEKWIKVLKNDGKMETVGLKEVFSKAHEFKSLSGDIPTQDLAIFRVLLAVMYSIYQREDVDGSESHLEFKNDAYERWHSLWSQKKFNPEVTDGYFEKYRDRFYLFHPSRPFFQSPIKTGTAYSVPKLNGELSESNNKVRLFSTVGGDCKKNMDYGDAARWLLHVNAFDDTASKSKDKTQQLPSPGPGWLGKIGPVFIEGENLFETLLLNFVLLDEYQEVFPEGQTIWESDLVKTSESALNRNP